MCLFLVGLHLNYCVCVLCVHVFISSWAAPKLLGVCVVCACVYFSWAAPKLLCVCCVCMCLFLVVLHLNYGSVCVCVCACVLFLLGCT